MAKGQGKSRGSAWQKRPPFRTGGGGWTRQRPAFAPSQDRDADPSAGAAWESGLPEGQIRLFGLHAVEAALANPVRVVHHVRATENAENKLRELIGGKTTSIEKVTPRDLDKLLGPDTVHQGVAIDVDELPEPELTELAAKTEVAHPLVVLDQITDPHNVGAILRSAAVFGASGLVMTRRHSPQLAGVLAKAASGALELVPVCRVQNLSRALAELQEAGVTVIGLDGEAETTLEDCAWPMAPALVLGAEGKGLRQLTRQTCDRLVRIDTAASLASLNVSNAAAVALHTAHRAARTRATR